MESLLPLTNTLALLLRLNREGRAAYSLRIAGALIFALLTVYPLPADPAKAADPAPASSATELPLGTDQTDQILLLEVVVNGHSLGQVGEFTLRNGSLYARPQGLRDLGFLVNSPQLTRDGLVALNDLPGFKWTLDTAKQQLLVTASDAILAPALVQLTAIEPQDGRRRIESGTGLTLNYDTVGTFANGQNGGSGSFDLRNFSRWGITSSDWLTYTGSALSASGTKPFVRLDSSYTFADVNSLRRYSAGDFINGGLGWNRAVHMEGLQIRSDFTMRPDLVTFPLPSLSGSAAVPSTVDVLVNGNLAASSTVNPGPFQVPQLPVISGSGTITMTLTNAQGGQVTVTQPFYGGSLLLAKGLQTYAAQAGMVRRDWGTLSNEYGKVAGTAFYRRGLSQSFTFEAAAETTPGTFMSGAGGAATLWNRAMLNFDAAVSGGPVGEGELLSGGLQHVGRIFSMGGSATLASRNYRDVAAMNGSPIQRKQISAFTGLSARRFGSFGLAYAAVCQDPSPVQLQSALMFPLQSHVVTANYAVQFRNLSYFATEFRDLDTAGSSGLQVGLTIPLGRRSAISVGAASNGTAQVQAQQSPVKVGDWGYQAYVSAGDATHEFAVVQYKSPVGLFSAGADSTSGQTTLRMESQGALSLVDRGVFPSNTIYDSFAIVDTAPLERVHVYQENRDVGTTDKSGRLLVPDMRAFDVNHIGIEARDIPADAALALDSRIVRPQDRSGVVIRFPIRFSHGALLRLVDDAGAPIHLGSTATLEVTGAIVPVGYDGEAYLEDLGAHNRITVELVNGKHCTARFDYNPVPGDIPTIGPISCQEIKP
jgi:outer membrane usher protein